MFKKPRKNSAAAAAAASTPAPPPVSPRDRALAARQRADAHLAAEGQNLVLSETNKEDETQQQLFHKSRTRKYIWDTPRTIDQPIAASRSTLKERIARETLLREQKSEQQRAAAASAVDEPCCHEDGTNLQTECVYTIQTVDALVCSRTGTVLQGDTLVLGGGHVGYSGPYEERANAAGGANASRKQTEANLSMDERMPIHAALILRELLDGASGATRAKAKQKKEDKKKTDGPGEDTKVKARARAKAKPAPPELLHTHCADGTAPATSMEGLDAMIAGGVLLSDDNPPSLDVLLEYTEAGMPLPCPACNHDVEEMHGAWHTDVTDITRCRRMQCVWRASSLPGGSRHAPDMVAIIAAVYHCAIAVVRRQIEPKPSMMDSILIGSIYSIISSGLIYNIGPTAAAHLPHLAAALGGASRVVLFPCVVYSRPLPPVNMVTDVKSGGRVTLSGQGTNPLAPKLLPGHRSRTQGTYFRSVPKCSRGGAGDSVLPAVSLGTRVCHEMMHNQLKMAELLEMETAGAGLQHMHVYTRDTHAAVQTACRNGSIVVTVHMTDWLQGGAVPVPERAAVPLVRADGGRARAPWDQGM